MNKFLIISCVLLLSCGKKPEACFNMQEKGLIGEPIGVGNCSENAEGYSWSFGDGNWSERERTSNVYSEKGDYEVTLRAYNKRGKKESKVTKNVKIGDLYLTNLTGNGTNRIIIQSFVITYENERIELDASMFNNQNTNSVSLKENFDVIKIKDQEFLIHLEYLRYYNSGITFDINAFNYNYKYGESNLNITLTDHWWDGDFIFKPTFEIR